MSNIRGLKHLKKADLRQLIEEIYGLNKSVDEVVNHYILSSEKPYHSTHSAIQNEFKKIRSEWKTIDSASNSYTSQLAGLLDEINAELRIHDLKLALRAVEEFLWLSNNIYERLDDTSDSDIGSVFRNAIEQWLEIATELRASQPEAENWIEKVLDFFDNNNYGVFDNIVSHSKGLLNNDELKQLAWRFNANAKRALHSLPNTNNYCSEAAQACFGLRSVAEAMEDMALFEKSYLLSTPSPNVLQMESIVRFALSIGNYERAKYWLGRPKWQTNYSRYKSLRNKLFECQGNIRELISLLAEDFAKKPCDTTLEPLWDLSNRAQKQSLYKKVSLFSKNANNPKDAIEMLFRVGNYDLADELLILHWHEFSDGCKYGKAPYWAEQNDQNVHPLACILRD